MRAGRGRGTSSIIIFGLFLLNEFQYRAQTFVVHNRGLVDLVEAIKNPIGQFGLFVKDFDRSIGVVMHSDPLAFQRARQGSIVNQVDHAIVLQRKIVR